MKQSAGLLSTKLRLIYYCSLFLKSVVQYFIVARFLALNLKESIKSYGTGLLDLLTIKTEEVLTGTYMRRP